MPTGGFHRRTEDSRALLACASFKGDALIVESERDAIIPGAVLASYRDALSTAGSLTYRVLSNADHALTSEADQQSYTALLVNWLTEMLFGARTGGSVARGSAHAGAAIRDVATQAG